MVELALDSHSSILIDSYHTKDAEKKTYIAKCVEDIKKVQMYLSHLSHVWMVQGRHRGCIMVWYRVIKYNLLPQGTWVVSALRQLHRFAKGFFRTGYHKDQVSSN